MSRSWIHPICASLSWALAVLMLAFVPSTGAQFGDPLLDGIKKEKQHHITFVASIAPSDPFSEMNQPKPPKDKKMEFQRGDTFLLTITGTPDKGWHTYPLTRRAPHQLEAQLGTLTLEGKDSFQPLYPIRESESEWADDRKDRTATDKDALSFVALEHQKPFTWTQEVYIKPTAPAGKTVDLPIKIHALVCEKSCIPEDYELTVRVPISSAPPLAPTADLQKRLALKPPSPEVVPIPKEILSPSGPGAPAPQKGGPGVSPPSERKADTGMVALVVKAVIGGFVSLLTPCVFPMIPITVSFFLKQAERRKSPALALAAGPGTGITTDVSEAAPEEPKSYPPVVLAAVYSGTIVLILFLGGFLLMRVLQEIISHYITNFVLSAVFLFFALSLLGMYDITLPSWLQDKTAAGESKGGLIGVFFMALTFSIVSFACIGPIYGGFIALGASDQSLAGRFWKAAPPVLGFSVAFASPFFLLALFPTLLKTMPRAGSWMNSVKVVIGFLELAAGVAFLRGGELALTKSSTFFTFDLCLGIYVAITVACGLYLLGLYRLPHDHGTPESISVPRLLFGLTFITLGIYFLPGLFKGPDGDSQRPRGKIYAWVESFLLPELDGGGTALRGNSPGSASKLVWHHKLNEALAEAKRDNKLVFLDVTGILCKNCRLNERDAFPDPRVQAAFAQHVLLKLYAEAGVPAGIDQQPGSEETIRMRDKVFDTNALPVYVLLKPKEGTEYGFEVDRMLTTSDNGLITDIPAFVKALSKE
jgi:thiol:disulfide interchange protein DsbD